MRFGSPQSEGHENAHHGEVQETRLVSASGVNPVGPGCVQPLVSAPATTPSSAKKTLPPRPEDKRRRWFSKLPLNIENRFFQGGFLYSISFVLGASLEFLFELDLAFD